MDTTEVGDLTERLRVSLGGRPNVEVIRTLVDIAEAEYLPASVLAWLAFAVRPRGYSYPSGADYSTAETAISAARMARRLTSGELDIATLVDAPTSVPLQQLLEQEIDRYETECDRLCIVMAGQS